MNLGKLPAFKGVSQHVAQNLPHYKRIFDSSDPHQDPLAGKWNTKLSMFQKMLFLRCIRVDKALLAIAVRCGHTQTQFHFVVYMYKYIILSFHNKMIQYSNFMNESHW